MKFEADALTLLGGVRVEETENFVRGAIRINSLGVPVLPVVVDSGRFWGVGGGTKRSGTIGVSFLSPIPPGMRAVDFVKMAEGMMQAERNRVSVMIDASIAVSVRP